MIARYEFSGLEELYKKLVLSYPGKTRDFWEEKDLDFCIWHLKILESDK